MTDNGAKALAERLHEAIADHDDICSRMAIPECADRIADAILAPGAVFLTAEEAERLRRIEAAARDAVDAAGTERWPVNCDALRAALADPEPRT